MYNNDSNYQEAVRKIEEYRCKYGNNTCCCGDNLSYCSEKAYNLSNNSLAFINDQKSVTDIPAFFI